MNNIIAVGDIHGCYKQLTEILEQIKVYPNHQLVFLGDYIDRGPDSELVCKTLKDIRGIFLKGNHEEMLLKRVEHYPERIDDLLKLANLSKSSLEWIGKSLKNIYCIDNYIFVHAGLDVNKNIEDQTEFDYIWTRWEKDYYSITDKTVIHGHSVIKEPEQIGNRININTGCGSGGYLTALVIPEMKYLRSSNSGGLQFNWEVIKKELEEDIGELEEIDESFESNNIKY